MTDENQPEMLLSEFHFQAGHRRQQSRGISSSTWPMGFATLAFMTFGTGLFFVVGSGAVPSKLFSHNLSLPLEPRGDAGGRHSCIDNPGIATYPLEGRIACTEHPQ